MTVAVHQSAPPLLRVPPPPSLGRVGEGGIAEHLPTGFPPPLTPPHKGEGNSAGREGRAS